MKNIKEKYIMMRDRRVYLTPNYWNGISQTHPQTLKYHGINPEIYLNLFQNGRMVAYYYKDLWDKAAEYISHNLYLNAKYYQKIKEGIFNRKSKALGLMEKFKVVQWNKISFGKLINMADNIFKAWLEYDMLNVPPWFWGGDRFKELVRENLKIADDDFAILTTPDTKTWASQMEFEFLEYAILIKNKKFNLDKAAQRMACRYAHLPFGYDGLEYWDKEYFIGKLKELVNNNSIKKEIELNAIRQQEKRNRKNKQQIIKKYKFKNTQLSLIDKMNELAVWTDERKELHFQLHYYYGQILLELSRRYGIPYKNLKFSFIEELIEIARDRSNILRITDDRINGVFFLKFSNGKAKILSPKERDKILREIAEQDTNTRSIKGMVASRGTADKYRARVKILLSPKEINKIQKGDFLIANMTTPDYILAMKKAAGFITDEGGVTCHAAIVGREMNKPCVIGTKVATKILKDNDWIEVDTKNGTVKKIH